MDDRIPSRRGSTMAVIRHSLPLPLAAAPWPGGTRPSRWEGDPEAADAVRALVAACRSDSTDGPALRPGGLLGELQSRPGRLVDAWLALGDEAASPRSSPAGIVTLGLVTLVETPHRCSLGWLVVHPAWRRRGLARALVATAAAAAAARGARALAAETLSAWPAASAFWRALASVDS